MILKESDGSSRIHLVVEKRIESKDEFRANNHALVVIGTLIIWVGYLFFVSGKIQSMFDARYKSPAKLFHLVLISGASGAIFTSIFN